MGKRKLELSNLEKILFPDDSIAKAQVIEYYLKIAPTLLQHVKGRALTLIRFPEGIEGESFYQKNRPEWAQDWIETKLIAEISFSMITKDQQFRGPVFVRLRPDLN